ncbi:hypothetical protein DER45DRAFT_194565 [Fusarium avenaceum]|nr:hypothetical protein DER45DRAFT_194565 [Fusarium avenaceum]
MHIVQHRGMHGVTFILLLLKRHTYRISPKHSPIVSGDDSALWFVDFVSNHHKQICNQHTKTRIFALETSRIDPVNYSTSRNRHLVPSVQPLTRVSLPGATHQPLPRYQCYGSFPPSRNLPAPSKCLIPPLTRRFRAGLTPLRVFSAKQAKPTVPTEAANCYISFGGSSVRILAVLASSCSAPTTGNVVIKDGVAAMADPWSLESQCLASDLHVLQS